MELLGRIRLILRVIIHSDSSTKTVVKISRWCCEVALSRVWTRVLTG